jgi:hypothetical protein
MGVRRLGVNGCWGETNSRVDSSGLSKPIILASSKITGFHGVDDRVAARPRYWLRAGFVAKGFRLLIGSGGTVNSQMGFYVSSNISHAMALVGQSVIG